MPAWTSKTDLKARLGLSGTTHDGVLEQVLNGAERSAVAYLNFDPTYQSQTVYLDGLGAEVLALPRRPVPAAADVVGVWEDAQGYFGAPAGSFDATDTLLTAGTDYAFKANGTAGLLVRLGATWPASRRRPAGRLGWEWAPAYGTVKVEFKSGLKPAEMADVIEAVYLEAAVRFQRRFGLGAPQSESLDGRSLSFSQPPPPADGPRGPLLNPDALLLLRPHRLTPFA